MLDDEHDGRVITMTTQAHLAHARFHGIRAHDPLALVFGGAAHFSIMALLSELELVAARKGPALHEPERRDRFFFLRRFVAHAALRPRLVAVFGFAFFVLGAGSSS